MINLKNIGDPNIKDKFVSIIGLGRSGLESAKLANYLGARVFGSDSSEESFVNKNAMELMNEDHIASETGVQTDRIYEADLWIVSPGISKYSKIILEAQKRGIAIVSELEFASWYTESPIIGITGSNGKTTTCLIALEMCKTQYKNSVVAGNIGIPLSKYVLEELKTPILKRIFITEVSSFQLEFIKHFKPHFAIYTNISPDHLDRHSNMEEYVSMKLRMVKNFDSSDSVIYNSDDPILSSQFKNKTYNKIPFNLENSKTLFNIRNNQMFYKDTDKIIDLKNSNLRGDHNKLNILSAATCASLLGISSKNIKTAIENFNCVEHRQESFKITNKVEYINDSKSTNINSVIVAIKTFKKPLILLLGGYNKGSNFRLLLPHIGLSSIKNIICYGDAGQLIKTAIGDAVRSFFKKDLNSAVLKAHKLAIPGDIIILSPGCSSFDQFKNFEERGKYFKSIVKKLTEND